jgi:hypothetical protein
MGIGFARGKAALLVVIVAAIGFGVVQGAGASGQKKKPPPKPKGIPFEVYVHIDRGKDYATTYVVDGGGCSASQTEEDTWEAGPFFAPGFRLTSTGELAEAASPLGTPAAFGSFRIEAHANGTAPGCEVNSDHICKGQLDDGVGKPWDPAISVSEANHELSLDLDTIRGFLMSHVTGSGSPNAEQVCQSTYGGTLAFGTALQNKLMFKSGHEHNIYTVHYVIPTKDLLRLKPGHAVKKDISSEDEKYVALRAPKDCNKGDVPGLTCTMIVHWEGYVRFERMKQN